MPFGWLLEATDRCLSRYCVGNKTIVHLEVDLAKYGGLIQ